MPNRDMPPGPTGQRVAENVAALREARGWSKTELGRLLAGLGRPMTLDVLAKLENQQRRIDADDLVALAIALRVTPNRLLLSEEAGDAEVQLTPVRAAPGRDGWAWACGDKQLPPTGREPYLLEDYARFPAENRPHRDHSGLTIEQQEQLEHVLGPVREALHQASKAGVSSAALVDFVESTLSLETTMTSVRDYVAALQHKTDTQGADIDS